MKNIVSPTKLLLAAALLGATSSFALAADLPSRRAPPVYVPPIVAPAFSWSGFYAGINAGYTFNNNSNYNIAATNVGTQTAINTGVRPGFLNQRSSGFTGGGQIGYNFQLGGTGIPVIGQLGGVFGNGGATGGLVGGIEADAAYTDARSNTNVFGTIAANENFNSRVQYVGTVRGRLGYAFGDLFIYGTGGFAYGGVRNTVNYYNVAGVNDFAGRSDSIRTGYAYGGGVEYAIPTTSFVNFFHSSAVTLKAEFIHYDLGTQTTVIGSTLGTGNSYIARIKNDGNLVRAGINYKVDLFGSPAAPVVARY